MEGLIEESKLPDDFVSGNIALERYYEAMHSWRIQSSSPTIDDRTRFILLMRVCSLFSEHLPHHPQYNSQRYVKWHSLARPHIEWCLGQCEQLKQHIALEMKAKQLGLKVPSSGTTKGKQREGGAMDGG